MIDAGNDKETRPPRSSPETSVIIDATAQRRSRVHEPEPDRRKGVAGVGFLEDVPLKVNVVLAQTTMPLGEILALGTDSVVQLDKPSGDPVDIYIENQKLGRGEVIVLQEKLRIRVIEITPVSPGPKEYMAGAPEEK